MPTQKTVQWQSTKFVFGNPVQNFIHLKIQQCFNERMWMYINFGRNLVCTSRWRLSINLMQHVNCAYDYYSIVSYCIRHSYITIRSTRIYLWHRTHSFQCSCKEFPRTLPLFCFRYKRHQIITNSNCRSYTIDRWNNLNFTCIVWNRFLWRT